MVEKMISGDYQKQYELLSNYVLELLNSNLYSIIRIYVHPRLRYFLGVDGILMRGPYPKHVLIVVSLDSNNGIYHVTYTIV